MISWSVGAGGFGAGDGDGGQNEIRSLGKLRKVWIGEDGRTTSAAVSVRDDEEVAGRIRTCPLDYSHSRLHLVLDRRHQNHLQNSNFLASCLFLHHC
jgi:hypothetical protein